MEQVVSGSEGHLHPGPFSCCSPAIPGSCWCPLCSTRSCVEQEGVGSRSWGPGQRSLWALGSKQRARECAQEPKKGRGPAAGFIIFPPS